MPTEKIKNPSLFPPLFTHLLNEIPPDGAEILVQARTEAKCKLEAKRWRAFIRSYQEFPNAMYGPLVREYRYRTKTRKALYGAELWQLLIYRERRFLPSDFTAE